ncbi:MAG: SGNH/GDSL hydrolase family protein [Clostridia bacterium]|nr:SGNH/GDSL hydrolase family protein [Clostridia bacterium]
MSNDISKIDKNLSVETTLVKDGIYFYDVRREPFRVYGLYDYKDQPHFRRLPAEVAAATSDGVAALAKHTSGGRVRFCTDSPFVCIKTKMNSISLFSHMPASGAAGFDLFIDSPDGAESRYVRTFMPPWHTTDAGYESKIDLGSKKLRYFTINFPSYSGVDELWVGISEDATLGEGLRYRDAAPILYYGSSITQGGCASRSGNIYQNVVCRRTNFDYINLGFSGNGRGEDAIVDYMASLDISAFVCDYDHNSPSRAHLSATHYKMYEKIRAAHPDIPYIMLSKCDLDNDYNSNLARREVVYESFCRARANGDKNVYYIDGASIFRGPYQNMCTVDSCHPNDLGFALMADAITAELERAMTQNLF